MRSRSLARRVSASLALLALIAVPSLTAETLRFDDAGLAGRIASVPEKGSLRIEGLPLRAGSASAFELRRFRVFTEDARIVVHSDATTTDLPAPDNAYFRGSIAGEPGSIVVLSVASSTGALRGIAAAAGDRWLMELDPRKRNGPAGLQVRRLEAGELTQKSAGFACETGDDQQVALELPEALAAAAAPVPTKVAGYTAKIAVQTDYEYYQLFGSINAATDYVGDLFAFISTLYEAEVDTTLLVSYLSLWTTSADPWTQTSPGCGLMEFGRYWNDNNGGITRTTAHFLSGKASNAGVAWIGVLCGGAFNYFGGSTYGCPSLTPDYDNYGGAYGYTGGIDGNFDINSPQVFWDIVAVAHEIGHNFNSPHSHCYAGLEGNASPVDECYAGQCGQSGCYCGPTSLPCGGTGCGTIMSYCHVLAGGLSNIALTFGDGHPYGVAPERVPIRMNSHVVSRASSHPGCLDYTAAATIFTDGFESGNVSAWDASVP